LLQRGTHLRQFDEINVIVVMATAAGTAVGGIRRRTERELNLRVYLGNESKITLIMPRRH